MRRASAVLAAMTMPPVFRSMRLHRAGVKACSGPGVPLLFLIEVGLDVGDEGVDVLVLVGVDHQAGPLVHQQDVLVLVDDVQLGLEDGQKGIFRRGGRQKTRR